MVRLAGYIVLAASILFLGLRFYSNFEGLLAITPGWLFYTALGVASLCYGVMQFFLIASLSVILKGLGAARPYFTKVLVFHGRTDIAKYLPGNVFHFVGRQILAKNLGWSQATVGLASLAETALVLIGAGLAILIYASMTDVRAIIKFWPGINIGVLLIAASAGIAGAWLVCAHAARISMLSRHASARNIQNFSRSVRPLLATGWYVLFFLLGGVVFWSLLSALKSGWQWSFLALSGFAYVLSWIAGKVSPGAPGGLGVREAMLTLLLSGVVGEAEALMLALAMRIVTSFGDFFLFAITFLFPGNAEDHGARGTG